MKYETYRMDLNEGVVLVQVDEYYGEEGRFVVDSITVFSTEAKQDGRMGEDITRYLHHSDIEFLIDEAEKTMNREWREQRIAEANERRHYA